MHPGIRFSSSAKGLQLVQKKRKNFNSDYNSENISKFDFPDRESFNSVVEILFLSGIFLIFIMEYR